MRTFRLSSTLAAGLVAAALLVVPAPGAVAGPATPRLAWAPCHQDVGAEFGVDYECADLQVPLDHDRPNGAKISLAAVRLPAADPANKVGSILLNPGGPGGSGVEFALFFGPFAGEVWGPRVRERFDIVGFDPRGVLRSRALKCFGNERQAAQVFAPFTFPWTAAEEQEQAERDMLLAERCDQRGGRVGEHMATANVARDLDLLRASIGDEKLTYVGGSYGSFLGVTYANLFGDRVRAIVIDGILDPIAWVNAEGEIPVSTRLRSDEGAMTTLRAAFDLCAAAAEGNCALAPDPAARFDALAQRLRDEPLRFEDPATGQIVVVTYADFIGTTLNLLYDPFRYPMLAELGAALEAVAFTEQGAVSAGEREQAARFATRRGFPRYRNVAEAFPAVICTDSNNPDSHAAWSAAGAAADAEFGYFGRPWTWASSMCATWPLADDDRYLGPFDGDTANPVLIIGNRQDPATRYQGALTVRGLLPNSALVTVEMPGHTSLGISGCAGAITGQYILDPAGIAAAVDGAVCPREFNPFDLLAGGPGPQAQPGLAPELRARYLATTGRGYG